MIRILTFTSLYPNERQPQHGVFVEQRLRHLLASGEVEAQVLAPVPWFPLASGRFGRYAEFAAVPREELRHGIRIEHPRYPVVPKIGMTVSPALMAAGVASSMLRLHRGGWPFEVIDAHYFYPDGVAAALIARRLKKPFVVTARGTDINLIPKYRLARAMILWAARRAAAIITVSSALKDELLRLGVEDRKVTVLRNGVDLETFRPINRDNARRQVGAGSGFRLLSVGGLIERKGHHLTIEALGSLPDVSLSIIGQGPMEQQLRDLAARLGVADRVEFRGAIGHDELATHYSAADAMVLASSREGMANVLLESIACGLPVVATPIWGTPEVIARPEAGVLTEDRSAAAIAKATQRLIENYPDRAATRRYAERFSWDATTAGQVEIFRRVSAA